MRFLVGIGIVGLLAAALDPLCLMLWAFQPTASPLALWGGHHPDSGAVHALTEEDERSGSGDLPWSMSLSPLFPSPVIPLGRIRVEPTFLPDRAVLPPPEPPPEESLLR